MGQTHTGTTDTTTRAAPTRRAAWSSQTPAAAASLFNVCRPVGGRGPPAGTTVDEGAPHQHGGGKRRPTGRQQRGSEPTLVQQLPTQRGACVARGTDACVCPQRHHPPLAGKRAHTPRAPPRRAGCRARSGSPATQTGCGPATFHAMFLPTNRPPPRQTSRGGSWGGEGGCARSPTRVGKRSHFQSPHSGATACRRPRPETQRKTPHLAPGSVGAPVGRPPDQ